MQRHRNAFTLVELSISLVVIGLLVGGILAGKSIIQAAGLRALTNDLSQYQRAALQFKDEYGMWPGDLKTATSYWGVANGVTGNDDACYGYDKSNVKTTCNGDGNGAVQLQNPANGNSDATEAYLAWQHLAISGLIGGMYSGKSYAYSTPGYGTVAGWNSPVGKMKGSTFLIRSVGGAGNGCSDGLSGNYYAGCFGVVLHFGGAVQSTTLLPVKLLTPADMQSLDKKLDDGFPGYGQFQAILGVSCSTDAENYALTVTSVECAGLVGLDAVRMP